MSSVAREDAHSRRYVMMYILYLHDRIVNVWAVYTYLPAHTGEIVNNSSILIKQSQIMYQVNISYLCLEQGLLWGHA